MSHAAALESLGARQSPRGDSDPPLPTFGAFGIAERLNWLVRKKRSRNTPEPVLDLRERVLLAPRVLREERDLARQIAEAEHVVQEEVLELVRTDDAFAVRDRPIGVRVIVRNELGGDLRGEHGLEHLAGGIRELVGCRSAQRIRNWMSVFGTEALTL